MHPNELLTLILGESAGSKARLAVGSCLGTLAKFNLLKGSIAGAGLFTHDIVRDYVISQHAAPELRALQHEVVKAVLAARPEPDGFGDCAPAGTFEGYIARRLYWHIRGALADSDEPPDAWLIHHPDAVIKLSAATAFGFANLEALSAAKEAAGELVHAAKVAFEASSLKQISPAVRDDLVYRAAALLETANDPTAAAIESTVLLAAWAMDRGSERWAQAQRRAKVVAAADPFKCKFNQCLVFYGTAAGIWKDSKAPWPGPPEADVREATRMILEVACAHMYEAQAHTQNRNAQKTTLLQLGM